MSLSEEEEYAPLRATCEKLKDLIENIGTAKEMTSDNTNKLKEVEKEIVSNTSSLVDDHLQDKIIKIKNRINPLMKETEELIAKIKKRNLRLEQRTTKKLFSKRDRKKQNLEG